ncbi:hypothetical protein Ciccas_006961 [Cichlidogyrus casuarinus]|uniref:G-protein coupled receptors family 1 profile domain-containing protein n=1 Tax=Cichlidogyrus casuarinus TaxID=1844966 RepID=A0ABD2Q864_9PLAT
MLYSSARALFSKGFISDPSSALYPYLVDEKENAINDSSLRDNIRENILEDYCSTSRPPNRSSIENITIFFSYVTLVANLMILIVLGRQKMRSPTNLILFGIALVDLVAAFSPAVSTWIVLNPRHIASYFIRRYLYQIIPIIAHQISVYFTLLLAWQRYFYVYKPMEASKMSICQNWGVIAGMLVISFVFILFNCTAISTQVFKRGINVCAIQSDVPMRSSNNSYLIREDINRDFTHYELTEVTIYYCTNMGPLFRQFVSLTRLVICNVIPALMLIILTILLIVALKKIARRRRNLLAAKEKSLRVLKNNANNGINSNNNTELSKKRSFFKREKQVSNHEVERSDSNSTSRMMLVVLLIFLIVELPTVVLILIRELCAECSASGGNKVSIRTLSSSVQT